MAAADLWHTYSIVLYCLGSLLFLLNTLCNVIFLLVVRKRIWTKKKIFLALISWTSADLLLGLLLFVDIIIAHLEWLANVHMYLCLLWNGLHMLPLFVAGLQALLCAIDRFIVILYPNKYEQRLSRSKMIVLIAVSWLYSLVMSCVPFLWHDKHTQICTLAVLHFVYVFLYVLLHFIPISVACMVLYCKVFMHFRRHERQVHVTHTLTHDELVANTCLAKQTVYMTLIHITLWIPFCVVAFARLSDLEQSSPWHEALLYTYLTGLVSSLVKCPCFMLLDESFRNQAKALFRKKKKQAQFGSSLRD